MIGLELSNFIGLLDKLPVPILNCHLLTSLFLCKAKFCNKVPVGDGVENYFKASKSFEINGNSVKPWNGKVLEIFTKCFCFFLSGNIEIYCHSFDKNLFFFSPDFAVTLADIVENCVRCLVIVILSLVPGKS